MMKQLRLALEADYVGTETSAPQTSHSTKASPLTGMAAALGLGLLSIFQAEPVTAQDPVYEFSQTEMLDNKGTFRGNIALQEWRRMRANILRDAEEKGGVFLLKEHSFTADYLDDNKLEYSLYHGSASDGNGRLIPNSVPENLIGNRDTLSGLTGGIDGDENSNMLVTHEFAADDLILNFNTHSDYWVVVHKLEADRGVISNYGNTTGSGSARNDNPETDWSGYGAYYATISAYEISPVITDVSVSTVAEPKFTATGHKDAMGYYVVVAENATAPKPQEVVDGTDYDNVTVLASGSVNMEAGVPVTADLEGLTPGVNYDLYLVGISDAEQYLGRRTDAITFSPSDNTSPSISEVQPQSICQGTDHEEMPLLISDEQSSLEQLSIDVSSSDTTIVPDENIAVSEISGNLTLKVTPNEGATGTVEITLIATDPEGATAEATFEFSVKELPVAELSPEHASCSDNQDGALLAEVTGGEAPYTLEWSTGAQTQEITGLAPGTYTLEITDAQGCKGSGEATIIVEDEEAPTVDCSNFTTICEGPFAFEGMVSVDDNCSATLALTEGPEVGAILTPGQQNVVFTAEDPSGNTATCSTTLEVAALPEVDLGEDLTVPQGDTLTLVAGDDPDASYLWSTGETTAEISIVVEEDLTISVSVINSAGCETGDEIEITADNSLDIATAESGNGFTLYPNPSAEVINLSFGLNRDLTNASITVFDLQGKQVLSLQRSQIADGQVVSVDVSQLPQGLYVATITTDRERMTARFSKR